MQISNYIKDERHLPDFLKDFHDQKDFFKLLWEWQNQGDSENGCENHTWVSQHIYTVDIFLHLCALFGYRLEKIRSPKMDSYSLTEHLKDYRDRSAKQFFDMFNNRNAPKDNAEAAEQQPTNATSGAIACPSEH